eukprot:4953487-Alexandrium_andersonii.AAC.1
MVHAKVTQLTEGPVGRKVDHCEVVVPSCVIFDTSADTLLSAVNSRLQDVFWPAGGEHTWSVLVLNSDSAKSMLKLARHFASAARPG